MKKTLSLFFIAAALLACKKQATVNDPLEEKLPTLSIRDSKLYVAKTLAAAVEKEPALRQFLKDEALKQFDHTSGDPIFKSYPLSEWEGQTTYEPYEVFLGSVYLTIQPRPVF